MVWIGDAVILDDDSGMRFSPLMKGNWVFYGHGLGLIFIEDGVTVYHL